MEKATRLEKEKAKTPIQMAKAVSTAQYDTKKQELDNFNAAEKQLEYEAALAEEKETERVETEKQVAQAERDLHEAEQNKIETDKTLREIEKGSQPSLRSFKKFRRVLPFDNGHCRFLLYLYCLCWPFL